MDVPAEAEGPPAVPHRSDSEVTASVPSAPPKPGRRNLSAPVTQTSPPRVTTAETSTPQALALSIVVVNYRRPDESIALCRQLDQSDAVRSSHAEVVLVD